MQSNIHPLQLKNRLFKAKRSYPSELLIYHFENLINWQVASRKPKLLIFNMKTLRVKDAYRFACKQAVCLVHLNFSTSRQPACRFKKFSARQEKLLVSLSSDLPVLVSYSWSLTPDLSVLVSWPPKVILLEEENRPYGFLLPTSLTLSEER